MLKRMMVSFAMLICSVLPSMVAAKCEDVTNQIYADIKHDSQRVGSQKLPWMQFSWLQRTLGKPRSERLANGQTKYSWQCNKNSFITVRVDTFGRITKVSGQYNSAEGSGLFYAFLQTGQSS